MSTLSELDSRVFLELPDAAEYLDIVSVHNAVVQALNVRTKETRESNIDVLLATSAQFSPTTIPYDITSLVGKSKIAWVETLTNTVEGINWWRVVRIVPLNQLTDYAMRRAFCCTIWSEEPTGDETSQPTANISFSFLPSQPCRIRFERDSERTAMTAQILLPDTLSELIVLEAQQKLIPRVKNRIAARLRSDEDGRKIAPIVLQSLSEVYAQNVIDLKPLDALWRSWAYRAPGADSAFNLPTPNSGALYAVSGAGYGGWGYYGNSVG